jgi:hypothetical protein
MARPKSRTTKQDRKQKPFTYTRLEQLEPRLLLSTTLDLAAATPAPNNITFTDNNGDIVTVQLQGTAGQAVITSDDVTTNVVNGSQITGIAITGASTDFVMKFSVDSFTNVGTSDGVVALGNITSDRVIGGLLHVADTTGASPASVFDLTSFTGPGLSAGGMINVDQVDGNILGDALVLTQGLGAGQVVDVSGKLTGNVTLGGRTGLGGTINAGVVGDLGTWTIAGGVLNSGMVGVNGADGATTMISGPFAGMVNIGGNATKTWTINSIAAGGRMAANQWSSIAVTGDVSGTVASHNNLTMTIGGSLQATGQALAEGEVVVDVARNVAAGSLVTTDYSITGTVGGSFAGRYCASEDVSLAVTGSMTGGTVNAGSDITLGVGGAITGAKLSAGTYLSVAVAGSITNATLFSGINDISLDVGGGIVNSTLETGYGVSGTIDGSVTNSTFEGSESHDIVLVVGGSISGSLFNSGSQDVSVAVTGNVTNSTFTSFESLVQLTVGGSMSGSRVEACSYITVDVTGNLTGSVLFNAYRDISLHVHGNLVDTTATSATHNVSADIGGYMLRSRLTSASNEVTLAVGSYMQDSTVIAATGISADVSGNVTNCSFTSPESEVSVDVGGNVTNSEFISASSDVTVDVGGNFAQSVIMADDTSSLAVGGSVSGSINIMDGSMRLTAGGSILAGTTIITASNLTLSVGGSMNGSLLAGSGLDLMVTGSIGSGAVIQAGHVVDLNADNVGFSVGGTLGGRIEVFGNFNTGTGAAATVVGGSVLAGTKIDIGGTLGGVTSAGELDFGAMLGELDIGHTIASNLHFAGNVTQIVIGGPMMSDITATGRVAFLTSGSLYIPVTATTGNFQDGAGTTTFSLTAGSLGIVGPQKTVAPPAAAPFSVLDLSAATPAPASARFTDPDGDVITIYLTGTAGSVSFVSVEVTVNGLVDNGENLLSATITGASADFVMTFSVNSGGVGADGNVQLGDITSDRAIRGIYTVADTTGGAVPASLFELRSFSGPGFTTSGGLSVDQIDGNLPGTALALTQGVQAGQTIFVDGTLAGNVSLGRWGLAGTIDVDGTVGGGAWTLGPVVNSGFLAVDGNIGAFATATGAFSGLAAISGTVFGTWTMGSIAGTGSLGAGQWNDLQVAGNVDGTVFAGNSDITLTTGGSLNATSRVISGVDTSLTIGGSVQSGAIIMGGSTIHGSVRQNFSGRTSTEGSQTLAVGGSVIGAGLFAEGNLSLTTNGSITNSKLESSDAFSVSVAGSVTGSTLSTAWSEMILSVGGNIASSTIITGEYGAEVDVNGSVTNSVFELGYSSGSTLSIGGSITGTRIDSYYNISADVGGSITNSSVVSVYYDVTLDVGGQVTNSQIESASDISLTVMGSMTGSRVFGDEGGTEEVGIGGSLTNSKIVGGSNDISVNVGGSVTGSWLSANYSANLTVTVAGQMSNSSVFASDKIDMAVVTGGVTNTPIVNVGNEITLTTGGSVTNCEILCPTDDVTAAIGGSFTQSVLVADETSSVTIGGSVSGTLMTFDGSLSVTAGGAVLAGSTVYSNSTLQLAAASLAVVAQGGTVDLAIAGNVAAGGGLMANVVADSNGDFTGFFVGGTFAGRMNVSNTFNTGAGATATLMGGAIQTGAKLNIVGAVGAGAPVSSATQYVFQGAILGEFDMLGDLGVNLLAIGPVAQVSIGGSVKAGILSGGKITALTTGSSFQATSATGGTFRDGFGTATGTLTAASFGTVRPRV